jgi:hypothetical protein
MMASEEYRGIFGLFVAVSAKVQPVHIRGLEDNLKGL